MEDVDADFDDLDAVPQTKSGADKTGVSRPALYLVGTPIGNLEDITLRALRVLKEVDVIACEDTRQTQKLLNHYAIATRTTSYHEHNEMTKSAELVKEMQEGTSVALVTRRGDAGDFRSGVPVDYAGDSASCAGGADPGGSRRFWRRWWRAGCRRIRFASADFFRRSAGSGGRRWRRSRVLRGRRCFMRLRIGWSRRWRMWCEVLGRSGTW